MKIAIVTDIHENARLLTKALQLAEDNHCDEIASLGDIAGFDRRFFDYESQRSARECVKLVKANCKWVTNGNHDLHAAQLFPAYSNGFTYPADWFRLEPVERKKISQGKVWCYEGDSPNDLTEEDIQFLREIPEFIITGEPGVICLFSHYFAPDYTGSTTTYIERRGQLCHHWNVLTENNVMYSFTGHSHNQFTGFAYKSAGIFSKAVQSFPGENFNLGNEKTAIVLTPLSGEKGKRGFTIFDTAGSQIRFINLF